MCVIKKELTIQARFDTSDFDRSVESLQRKLRELYAPADMVRAQTQTAARLQQIGMGGIMSAPTPQAQQQASLQQKRELEQFIRDQAQGQEKLTKLVAKREEKLNNLKKLQLESIKDSKEELALKEKISKIEENSYRLRESYKQRDAVLNRALDLKAGGTGGTGGVGGGGMGSAGANLPLGAFKGVAIATAALAAGAATLTRLGAMAENIRRTFSEAPYRTIELQAQASGLPGASVQRLEQAASGKGMEEFFFRKEREQAHESARKIMEGRLPGGGLSSKTLLSRPIQTVLAGVAGITGSQDIKDLLQSQIEKEFYGEQASQFEALKKGPRGAMGRVALDQYMGGLQRDVGFQRSMGLNFQQFRGPGGFIPSATGAGFTPEMAMQASMGIMGAGGSTLSARQSPFALKAQRAFDLTNAPQLMGQIGGAVGGGESTKQAMISMLASGTALGLDQSDYREENRKYLDALAGIMARSGARTEQDFDRLSAMFSGFVAEKTPAGIQAANTAFGLYQQASMEQSGPRAVMRQAALLGSDVYGKLSMTTQQALNNISPEMMTASHPTVEYAAKEAGTTPEEILRTYSDARKSSMMVWNITKGKMLQGQAAAATGGLAGIRSMGDPALTAMYEQQTKGARGAYGTYLAGQPGFEALANPRVQEAFEGFMEQMGPGNEVEALNKAKQKTMGALEGGATRPEDLTIAGQAQFAAEMNENILNFKDSLAPATDAVKEFADSLMTAVLQARGASGSEIEDTRRRAPMSPAERMKETQAFSDLIDRSLSGTNASELQNQAASRGSANSPNSSSR